MITRLGIRHTLTVTACTSTLVLGGLTAVASTASATTATHQTTAKTITAAANTTTHPRVRATKARPDTSGKFTNFVTTDNTNIRSGPSTTFPIVGHVALTTQGIADYCYTSDGSVNGNTYWDLIYDPYNRIGGFVSETLLANTSQTLPC